VAQLGTIRINNNTIQDCYGGIWLVSMANSALTNAFDLIPSGDAGVRSELVSVGVSALGDPIFVLALGIARVLPTTPPVGLHIIGRPIPAIDPATLTLATQGLRTFLNQAASSLPAAAALTPSPRLATTLLPPAQSAQPAQPAGSPPSSATGSAPSSGTEIMTLLPNLNNILTNLGAAVAGVPLAADTGTTAVLRLALAGSQVDAIVPSSYSGAALLVADLTSTPGSALITGNRIRNRFPSGQAAVVLGVADAAAVTGNIIANESPIVAGTPSAAPPAATTTTATTATTAATAAAAGAAATTSTAAAVVINTTHSLLLRTSSSQATPPVAIVGNVFVNSPILPDRPDQLPQWLTLNTVVPSTGA